MKVTTRRALLARRTPAEWIVRVALALVAAVLGYFGITHSMALAAENADAERAYRLAPHDGRIVASAAAKRFAVTSEPAAQGPIAQLALTALRQDAMAVKAVNMLGLQSQLHGDTVKAQRLFNYAERLSRRELQTQLWSIENAVARNDVPGALRHYDIALRTNKSAPDILFPILAGAISDPIVRTSAVATLAGKPIWAQSFIVFVAGGGEDPRAVADLLLRLHRRGMRVPDEPSTVVINRLIHDGAAEDAWRYYAAIRPGVKRNSARDPGFAAVFDRPTAFDWTPVNENNVSASVQRTPEGGIFAFSVSPGAGGVLLQQTQMLPPGKYRLDGKSSEIELPQRASPYWVLSCRSGAELGRVVVPNSSYNRGTFSGQFIVPSECPVQTLALVARPSEEISGSSGQIEQVRLIPAG